MMMRRKTVIAPHEEAHTVFAGYVGNVGRFSDPASNLLELLQRWVGVARYPHAKWPLRSGKRTEDRHAGGLRCRAAAHPLRRSIINSDTHLLLDATVF
jgi:hypothetical protein